MDNCNQIYHLAHNDFAELTALHITERIISKLDAVEALDGVAERGEGAADLAVTTLCHGHFPLISMVVMELCERELTSSIVELNAKITDHLLVERLEVMVEADVVYFCLDEFRVGHAVSEITVIGQEDEARALAVETADGFEMVVLVRNEVINRWVVALCSSRADVAGGLIEREIAIGDALSGNRLARDADACAVRNPRAKYSGLVVDHDCVGVDEDVGFTTRNT